MAAKTSRKSGSKQQVEQQRLEQRLGRVMAALLEGKVEREAKLPGLSDTESQIFWYGFGCARDHLAHLLGSICDHLGDGSFAPGLRPGDALPWDKAPA